MCVTLSAKTLQIGRGISPAFVQRDDVIDFACQLNSPLGFAKRAKRLRSEHLLADAHPSAPACALLCLFHSDLNRKPGARPGRLRMQPGGDNRNAKSPADRMTGRALDSGGYATASNNYLLFQHEMHSDASNSI